MATPAVSPLISGSTLASAERKNPNPHRITIKQVLREEGYEPSQDGLLEYLQECMSEARCRTACSEGCEVECDGECEHGIPTVMRLAGVI